ncbi:hypothetical protein MAR_029219 [Mya arenaria]|uniref:Uncharacterized protein n=1 Tax=Mya arenaria TaxID=6604 RepID=A0ABY7DJ71_MYAAR|nr:hypothetical protein MAR_029219 [Mya arenaria]
MVLPPPASGMINDDTIMWRRHPDYPVCTALLLRVILSIILAKHSSPQELPSRETDHAFGINTHIQRNIFYDTNAIPEGLEVSPYLFVNTTKK